ncbi:hypothetical protein WEI85_23425 [Actinomycetes bacterium KLBMP 9797]
MTPEWAAVVVASIALVFSLSTVFQGRRSLRATTYRSATDLVLEVDRIFIGEPHLRRYFYDGEECAEADPEYQKVQAIAEFYLDIVECVWDHREFNPADRRAWREWIHDVFEGAPPLRTLYGRHPDWYPTLMDLFTWESCDKVDEHGWVRPAPGPSGAGLAFRLRRRLRKVPALRVATARYIATFPPFPAVPTRLPVPRGEAGEERADDGGLLGGAAEFGVDHA